MGFVQLDAVIAAGLDPFCWWRGGYPVEFIELILAWHSMRRKIDTHLNDAKVRFEEKLARRKGKR